MKKKVILRIIGIGIFHAFLYLYIVPFIIYPRFGNNGILFAIIVAVIVSIVILGTMFIGRNLKGEKKNG